MITQWTLTWGALVPDLKAKPPSNGAHVLLERLYADLCYKEDAKLKRFINVWFTVNIVAFAKRTN